MRNSYVIVLMLASATGGMIAVISCGDDAANRADAAETCDCSGFEPTLTAERIYRKRAMLTGRAGPSTEADWAICDAGDVVIGGGCAATAPDQAYDGTSGIPTAGPAYPVLLSSPRRFHDLDGNLTGTEEGWDCVFDNRANTEGVIRYEANAICLDIKPD